MAAVPLLISELERLTRDRAWSTATLCKRLGISVKSFYNVRAGETAVSLDFLARVLREFDSSPRIRDLALYFLAREYHERGRPGCGRPTLGSGPDALPDALRYHDRWRISAWVTQLARSTTVRHGLYLFAQNPHLLSAAARFVERTVEKRGIMPVTLVANARLSASHLDAALHAQVLIVERLDHIGDDVTRLLLARGEGLSTTLLTSASTETPSRTRSSLAPSAPPRKPSLLIRLRRHPCPPTPFLP
jgi:hypothetical protein